MIQLHPALSGAPLAFALLLLAVEILRCKRSFRKKFDAIRIVVVVACACSVIMTFLTGYQASSELTKLSEEVEAALGSHHAWGRMLLIDGLLMAALLWIASIAKHGRGFFLAFYYFSVASFVALALWVGYLGGSLVFSHGVGVMTAIPIGPEQGGAT